MTASDQTSSRGEATRQAILNAAEQLFMAQGYNGTSMRQIADAAGDIAVSGIYNHYKSKQEIFSALLELRSPYPLVVEIFESTTEGTGPEMLVELFRRMTMIFREHSEFVRLVAIDIQEHNADTIVSLISIVLPHAIKFFTRARVAGGIREDIEIFALARTFVSVLLGFNLTSYVLFQGDAPRVPVDPLPGGMDWLSATLDIFINGIAQQGNNQD